MSLENWGWDPHFERLWRERNVSQEVRARVIEEQKDVFRVRTEEVEVWAEISGRMHYGAARRSDLPAVGDWVAIRVSPGGTRAVVTAVLPRRTKICRKVAGRRSDEQVLAANVDTIFHVSAMGRDFSPRRIERYLAMIASGGARGVVLLNKADLASDTANRLAQAESAAPGVDVFLVSAATGQGIHSLESDLKPGETIAFVGSSGVGKTSLINRLLDEDRLEVQPVGQGTGRGRHTTTARHLVALPGGALLIDTPGMRELEPWDAGDAMGSAFAEIESLAAECRFRDCAHEGEPGCALARAVETGRLDAARLAGCQKLRREMQFQEVKKDAAARADQNRRWKQLHKAQKEFYKAR